MSTVDFEPSCWGDYFINNVTLLAEASKVEMQNEVRNLVKEVKKQLVESVNKPTTEQLELIDAIERLGVAYHFESEFELALDTLYENYLYENGTYDLYHVSLGLRILRQHGFNISCGVLRRFRWEKGFNDVTCNNNLKGILSLYEACHVGFHGDEILDEALEFTTKYLAKSMADHDELDSNMTDQVGHALHQPLHKGMIRLESKGYISFYEHNPSHNATLLRLAKLDFNLLQSMHQTEMRDLAIWWKGLHAKIPFTRDRSVEGYFWVLGVYYEPQHALARKVSTKIFMIIQMLDDIFDSYGTIQERQLFVDAVHRWDYSYVSKLPTYFSSIYKALLECCDGAEHDLVNEGRSPAFLHYWKEQMKIQCKAWLEEAKWCDTKYIPTYDEYIEVAIYSIGQTSGIVASYLGMGEVATKEGFEWSSQTNPAPKIIRASTVILRLMNDIGGHKFERGREHVASSVECYKKQHGISDEERVYQVLEHKVKDAWKDINEGMLRPYPIPKPLLDRILNLSRVPDVIYKARTEGYTMVNETIKGKIASVLIHPIPL